MEIVNPGGVGNMQIIKESFFRQSNLAFSSAAGLFRSPKHFLHGSLSPTVVLSSIIACPPTVNTLIRHYRFLLCSFAYCGSSRSRWGSSGAGFALPIGSPDNHGRVLSLNLLSQGNVAGFFALVNP